MALWLLSYNSRFPLRKTRRTMWLCLVFTFLRSLVLANRLAVRLTINRSADTRNHRPVPNGQIVMSGCALHRSIKYIYGCGVYRKSQRELINFSVVAMFYALWISNDVSESKDPENRCRGPHRLPIWMRGATAVADRARAREWERERDTTQCTI